MIEALTVLAAWLAVILGWFLFVVAVGHFLFDRGGDSSPVVRSPAMSVRAKFKVDAIERTGYTAGYEKTPEGKDDYAKPIRTEMNTIKLSPVYGNGDPNHENTKFWKASPSGSLTLGTINAEAAKQFELGKEYYVDFTPAE